MALLLVGAGALIYNLATPGQVGIEKDKITAAALAQAKAALIGYAAGVDISPFCGSPPNCPRPGDLPCPDTNDSGSAGSPNCNTQVLRIGRLPWKTLGLPDLRDGDGERLWYAVSNNFKKDTRTVCTAPGDAGCLNSDARGTITVRNSAGTVIYDGSNPDAFTPSGVIAVIFAPGAAIQRQDTGTPQDRSCTGGSCTAAGVCTSSPTTLTAKCNPINYLDVLSGTEDNAGFSDGSATDGFIQGPIRDLAGPILDTGGNVSGNAIVNDRLIVITYQDLMPVLQRRVAREVLNCLNLYAAVPQNSGRYPWAVPVANYPSYADQVNTRFGRLPDSFNNTVLGVGGWPATTICTLTGDLSLCMSSSWPTGCGITQGSWWTNWKEQVFYGVASAYAPASPVWWGPVPASGGCGSCLTVDPPSSSANKRVVVVVAGKRLAAVNGGQPRPSTDATNYVEGQNDGGATQSVYTSLPTTTTFNDWVIYR